MKFTRPILRLVSAVAVAVTMVFASGVSANATGGTVSISQSVRLQSGSASQAIDVPADGNFVWTVNFTCSNNDCHDGMVRLNFPASVSAGIANYSVSEVSRVIRSSTQLTFVLNPTIAVGTTSQITVAMSVPGWSTPDALVASLTSNFTTTDGENVTTAASTVTVHASNTTTAASVMTAGGRIGGQSVVTATFCPVAPVSQTVGPVGIAENSVVTGTLPVGATLVSAAGATYNAANNRVTWVVPAAVSGCFSYDVVVSFPDATFNSGDVATFGFTWTGKDVGSSAASRTLGTASNNITVAAQAPSGGIVQRISDPPQKWVGSTGSINLNITNPNDSSQQLDSVEISEEIPEGLGLNTITVANSSGGAASVYITSAWGADGVQGNSDDSVEYLAQSGIAAGSTAVITVSSVLPSGGAAVTGGNYVTAVRGVYGSVVANSGPLTLLRYSWTLLATTRSGATVNVGDLFPGTAHFRYTETVPGSPQTTVNIPSTSSTQVISEPPPPAPSLTTRSGLRNNMSANLLPGVRSVPMSSSFSAFSNVLPNPVLFIVQPEDTEILDSTMVVKLAGTVTTDYTVTRTANFSYNLGQGAKVGELIKFTFPVGTQIASNTGITVDYTLDLKDTLMGSPRVYSAFGSSTNNAYGMETQWWGTWCDSPADLDGDGLTGNNACTGNDVKSFALFFSDVIPATSVAASLTQSVKGSWDSAFVAGPSTGYTTPGASDDFRVSLRNRGTVPLDAATIITILPRPGDTNVLSSTLRSPSSVTFPVLLTSVPSVPNGLTGVTISYSTEDNICRTEFSYSPAGCVSPNWSTNAPGNLRTVTAIKFDLGANIINPGVVWNFDMSVTTPTSGASEADFAVENPAVNSPSTDEKAKSSSAFVIREYGQSNVLSAAESPAVTLQMPGPYGPAGTPPTAPDKASAGVGVMPQVVTVAAPTNGTVSLLNNSGSVSTDFVVAGQGRYTFANSRITFVPEAGFTGTADPVMYRVTDVFGQNGIATYTAEVSVPSGPSAAPGATTGEEGETQSFTPAVPSAGSLAMYDSNGISVSSLLVPGEGTYTINGGRIEFVPAAGFVGVSSIDFTVIDAYGQSAASTYTATVTPTEVVPEEESENELAMTGASVFTGFAAGFGLLIAAGATLLARRRLRL